MIVVAGIFDLLQVLLLPTVIGPVIIMIVAYIIFAIWFSHHDMSILDPRRALRWLGSLVGEGVIGIDGLPFLSATVAYTAFEKKVKE